MRRLEFSLDDFLRVAWVSHEAQTTWQPRIARIQAAWRAIEKESVILGVRSCAILTIDPAYLVDLSATLRRKGVRVLPLAGTDESQVVIGSPMTVAAFEHAWNGALDEAIGDLLGYPPCCRLFFRRYSTELRLRDPSWLMAGGDVSESDSRVSIDVVTKPETNVLARFVGVRAVPHIPCSFQCELSAELGRRLQAVGETLGFAEEMEWMRQILSWPYQWSTLHGIAEIRTPVLKVAVASDATACRHVVKLEAMTFAPIGTTGTRLPRPLCRVEGSGNLQSG